MSDNSKRGIHIELPKILRKHISKVQAIALENHDLKIGDRDAFWLLIQAGSFWGSNEIWAVDPNNFEQHIKDVIQEFALGKGKRN